MKSRFFLFNIVIIVLYCFLAFTYSNYEKLKDKAVGETEQERLNIKEEESLAKLANVQLSIYSIEAEELKQVKKDIMAKFQESDFQSLTIQPKAAFIDSLLYDSKMKKYMNSSNLKKSNTSLINKMKLYLPNELLISFLPKIESLEMILSIEDYLTENNYNYISGSNIPTVKSNIKHYYYDKQTFGELMATFSYLANDRNFLNQESAQIFNNELAIMILLFIFIIAFVQFFDSCLLTKNNEKIKFLLKGHINITKYSKQIVWSKSFSLILVLASSGFCYFSDIITNKYIKLDDKLLFFIGLTCVANLLIFVLKKERVDL